MRRSAAALASLGLLLPGCAPSGLEGVPPPKMAEAKSRRAECDATEAAIRPSRDRSANVSIAGYGLGLRDASFRTTSARDQYLVALVAFVAECRRWQRFDIGPAEYRQAQLRMADVLTATVDTDAVDGALTAFRTALTDARAASETDLAAIRADLAAIRERQPPPGAIEGRLSAVEAALNGARPGRGAERRWTIRFAGGSATPADAEMAAVRGGVSQALGQCRSGSVGVVGFTDEGGAAAANLRLAKRRADAVYDRLGARDGIRYLVSAGGPVRRFGPDPASNRIAIVTIRCDD